MTVCAISNGTSNTGRHDLTLRQMLGRGSRIDLIRVEALFTIAATADADKSLGLPPGLNG